MTEVPAVEPLSYALRFPLDVAKEALPIEGVVGCVQPEHARHPTYRHKRLAVCISVEVIHQGLAIYSFPHPCQQRR